MDTLLKMKVEKNVKHEIPLTTWDRAENYFKLKMNHIQRLNPETHYTLAYKTKVATQIYEQLYE